MDRKNRFKTVFTSLLTLLPIVAITFFHYDAANALSLRPARALVECVPGAEAAIPITIRNETPIKFGIEPVAKLEGLIVSYELRVTKDHTEALVTVKCLKPGLYSFRYYAVEMPRAGNGVGAVASAAGLLSVLVKGIRIDIIEAKIVDNNVSIKIVVSRYGVKVDTVKVNVTIGGKITISNEFNLNSSSRVVKTISIPLERLFKYGIKSGQIIEVSAYAHYTTWIDGARVELRDFAVRAVKLARYYVNLSLFLSGPTIVIPIPGVSELADYKLVIGVKGNASSCTLTVKLFTANNEVSTRKLQAEANRTYLHVFSVNLFSSTGLMPSVINVTAVVEATCLGGVSASSTTAFKTLVVPFYIPLFTSVAVLVVIARRVKKRKTVMG